MSLLRFPCTLEDCAVCASPQYAVVGHSIFNYHICACKTQKALCTFINGKPFSSPGTTKIETGNRRVLLWLDSVQSEPLNHTALLRSLMVPS